METDIHVNTAILIAIHTVLSSDELSSGWLLFVVSVLFEYILSVDVLLIVIKNKAKKLSTTLRILKKI